MSSSQPYKKRGSEVLIGDRRPNGDNFGEISITSILLDLDLKRIEVAKKNTKKDGKYPLSSDLATYSMKKHDVLFRVHDDEDGMGNAVISSVSGMDHSDSYHEDISKISIAGTVMYDVDIRERVLDKKRKIAAYCSGVSQVQLTGQWGCKQQEQIVATLPFYENSVVSDLKYFGYYKPMDKGYMPLVVMPLQAFKNLMKKKIASNTVFDDDLDEAILSKDWKDFKGTFDAILKGKIETIDTVLFQLMSISYQYEKVASPTPGVEESMFSIELEDEIEKYKWILAHQYDHLIIGEALVSKECGEIIDILHKK